MKKLIIRRMGIAAGFIILLMTALAGFNGPAAAAEADTGCIGCHGSPTSGLFVDQAEFQKSVHGALGCAACHPQMTAFPHEGKAADALGMCSACHSDIGSEFAKSVHGQLFTQGKAETGCNSCHGNSHAIVSGSNPASPVTHFNVVDTCGRCHQGEVLESYQNSFHGIANQLGSKTTAQCATCHGSHNILGPDDPASAVAEENIPTGCAKCHGGEVVANFANGPEHFTEESGGTGAPMYWTMKFFVWLTIVTITLLIIHIELELFRKLKETKS